MTEPITGITDRPRDPMAKWIEAFEEAYALTNIDQLVNQTPDPGLLRKTSGNGLQIRKITKEMLNDAKTASEIYAMALRGHLGFMTSQGPTPDRIVFRQEVVEKIGKNRITVINLNDPDLQELLNTEVGSIDDAAYASLAGVTLSLDPKQIATKNTLEKKKTPEPSEKQAFSTQTGVNPFQKKQKFIYMIRDGVRKIALNILKQVKISEKQRIKHAAEEREKEKKIKKEEIKKDVLNYEIQHSEMNRTEIKKSEEIVRKNNNDLG